MTTRRFNREQLLGAAFERTGHDDLGEPTWQEGLDRLLDDLADSARLNEVGVALVETETVNDLSNRLGIVAWRASHPGVSQEAVARPVVICGQPRTGTTILYDLLALDRSHRAPLTWEVDSPCPPPSTATCETDPRIDESQAVADMADVL
ncbi:MAG: sulfotransferase family protein, partial [Mycobacterium sp.]